DSIQDADGNLLGGSGLGNGNYNIGQTYTIQTIPNLLSPVGQGMNSTPTYKWSKLSGATKYQYDLIKGTSLVYSKIVTSGVCNVSSCLNTPINKLSDGAYKWRI